MSYSSHYDVPPELDHFDRRMEELNSASLGAMGSLLRKLDELVLMEGRVRQLIDDVGSINTKLQKLSEVENPSITVNYWMKNVRELSYDMEDCIDQFVHAEDTDTRTACIDNLLGFKTGLVEVKERYDRFNLKYGLNHRTTTISYYFPTVYREPRPDVHVGMEGPTNELHRLLEPKSDDENNLQLKVVSILGVQGVGKSTLCQKLSCQWGGLFECQAFVKTAKKPDMRMILGSILSQIHLKQPPEVCPVPHLIHEIRKHLEDKRYFIIIDDIWAVSVWDTLSRSFPEGNRCSRIVTTTTIEDVALACSNYDPAHIFRMKPLCAEHSKQLFISRVFGTGNGFPKQFNDISDDITRKCGDLPLAIICVASLVASQPEAVAQWRMVQNLLCHNLSTNSSFEEILKLCYHSLPRCLKTCLLYLSVYPENYMFLKDDLVSQWIAEDFICTIEGMGTADVASKCFDELLNLGLIQRIDAESNKKGLSYVVHPTVFDFITHKSMEDNFITSIDYSQSIAPTEKIRRLSLHFGSATYATLPASMGLLQVRSLIFMGLLNCMPSLVEFRLVRVMVLHLRSDDEQSRFSLLEMDKLLLLRYLQVQCNVTVVLPDRIRYHLKYLETLEINAIVPSVPLDIFDFPRLSKVCIGGKKNHKHLTPGPVASGKAIPKDDSSNTSTPSVQIFELLPPICIFSWIPEWIQLLRKLRILEIVVGEMGLDDIDVLAKLPVLTALSLYVQTPTAGNIVFRSGAFPCLEYLKMMCGVLSLDFKERAMPNLRKLKIILNAHVGEEYCNILGSIHHLLNLEDFAATLGVDTCTKESDSIDVESVFLDIITRHPCRPSFKVKMMGRVKSSNEGDKVLMNQMEKPLIEQKGILGKIPVQEMKEHADLRNKKKEAVMAISDIDRQLAMMSLDGYEWNKYGQKFIRSINKFRTYYRCRSKSCGAKKKVEWDPSDPSGSLRVVDEGSHEHGLPLEEIVPTTGGPAFASWMRAATSTGSR